MSYVFLSPINRSLPIAAAMHSFWQGARFLACFFVYFVHAILNCTANVLIRYIFDNAANTGSICFICLDLVELTKKGM